MKNHEINLLILIELAVFLVVVICSIGTAIARSGDKKSEPTRISDHKQEIKKEEPDFAVYDEVRLTFDEDIETALSAMTQEELLAQMFLVKPEDFTGNEEVTMAGEGCKNAISALPVGGMVCSSQNFLREDATNVNLSNLQTYSTDRIGWPMLLLLEEEVAVSASEEIYCILSAQYHLGETEFQPVSEGASLSVEQTKQIREGDGFAGILISESLNAIADREGIALEDATVQAVCAGMTVLYVEQGYSEAYQGALAAVEEGTITETMLHNAAGRVLSAKKHLITDLNQKQAEAESRAAEQARNNNRNRNNAAAAEQQAAPVEEPAPEQPQPEGEAWVWPTEPEPQPGGEVWPWPIEPEMPQEPAGE